MGAPRVARLDLAAESEIGAEGPAVAALHPTALPGGGGEPVAGGEAELIQPTDGSGAEVGAPGVGGAEVAPVAALHDLGAGSVPAVVADLGAVASRVAPEPRVARLGGRRSGRDREAELIAQRERGARRPRSLPDDQAPPRRRRAAPPRSSSTDGAPGPEPLPGAPGDREVHPERPRRTTVPKQIDPDADPVEAAREICLRLLTDRARTRQELAQALARRGVPDEAAHTVLERFDEVGLIDDAAFAGQWVRSRHRSRGLARRAIAQELRRKGVDDETAGEALAEVDEGAEARRARELVDRKLRTLPADTPEQRTTAARKLVGMLARKGYGAGTAYGVVREALAEHGADTEELGEPPAD